MENYKFEVKRVTHLKAIDTIIYTSLFCYPFLKQCCFSCLMPFLAPNVNKGKYSWIRVTEILKGYFCYKMITPQNVLSEAQVKNFCISQKSYILFSRYSSFRVFIHPAIWEICDVMMSIILVHETGCIFEISFEPQLINPLNLVY